MELKREDFINQYPPANHMNKAEVTEIWPKECLHLYIHIPFCIRKCGFCYYRSEAAGNRGVPEEYISALKKEIQAYAAMPEIQSRRIRSLYLGGGTPTLLSEQQLNSVLSLVMKSFDFISDFEFCSEARPGQETTISKLELLKSLGLNRLSLGCQSLDEDVLKASGCNHGVKEFYTVFEQARKVGVRIINTDLLSGLVNQSMDGFIKTIDGIIALRPENVSIYKMEVYLNSFLYKKLRQGTIKLISDEDETNHIRKGYAELLEAGYLQVDHFSFLTVPAYDHIQRRGLWHGEDMLGLGASAYSRMNSFLFQNEARVNDYIEKIKRGETTVVRAHRISQKEKMVQRMVFGLKNLKISRVQFLKDFGVEVMEIFPEQFKMLEREGFIIIGNDTIESTFEGALFADDIAREFYLPEHRDMMLGHVKRSELAV
jgi:oxygen-independent coproporphyrinogen III oxidase